MSKYGSKKKKKAFPANFIKMQQVDKNTLALKKFVEVKRLQTKKALVSACFHPISRMIE